MVDSAFLTFSALATSTFVTFGYSAYSAKDGAWTCLAHAANAE